MSKANPFQDPEGSEMAGVAPAKVTDIKDPEGLGRVKVEYPWRDADDQSYWARIATEMASSGYGTWFLPEVGDEVLVAFENGDIHHPYVLGSLYNGKKKPPYKHDGGSNNHRAIQSRSGHKFILNDESKKQKVTIETQAGHKIILDDKSGSEKVTIKDKSGNNSMVMDSVKGEISISAQKKISLSAPTIEAKAKTKIDLSSKAKVKIEGKAKVDVSAKGQLNLKSSGLGKLQASGPLQVKGAIIQLN